MKEFVPVKIWIGIFGIKRKKNSFMFYTTMQVDEKDLAGKLRGSLVMSEEEQAEI